VGRARSGASQGSAHTPASVVATWSTLKASGSRLPLIDTLQSACSSAESSTRASSRSLRVGTLSSRCERPPAGSGRASPSAAPRSPGGGGRNPPPDAPSAPPVDPEFAVCYPFRAGLAWVLGVCPDAHRLHIASRLRGPHQAAPAPPRALHRAPGLRDGRTR